MLRNLIILQGNTIEVVGLLWGFLWLTYLWLDSHVVLLNILESCPKWKNAIKTENVTENVPSYSILSVWVLWGAWSLIVLVCTSSLGEISLHILYLLLDGELQHIYSLQRFLRCCVLKELFAHSVHEVQCVSPSLLSCLVTFISPCILIFISQY